MAGGGGAAGAEAGACLVRSAALSVVASPGEALLVVCGVTTTPGTVVASLEFRGRITMAVAAAPSAVRMAAFRSVFMR